MCTRYRPGNNYETFPTDTKRKLLIFKHFSRTQNEKYNWQTEGFPSNQLHWECGILNTHQLLIISTLKSVHNNTKYGKPLLYPVNTRCKERTFVSKRIKQHQMHVNSQEPNCATNCPRNFANSVVITATRQ